MSNQHVVGWYPGATALLFCSGPSLGSIPMDFGADLPVLRVAVNQAATKIRPDLWICCDTPGRFHDRIWTDPRIRKFFPQDTLLHTLRRQEGSEIVDWNRRAFECPGAIAYARSYGFDHQRFFEGDEIQCGPLVGERCSLGIEGGRSVMLAALKILFLLGIRRVFLFGADFKMDARRPYVTDELRKSSEIDDNNQLYEKMNRRLGAILPLAEDARGFVVRNCTFGSGLTSVRYVQMSTTMNELAREFPRSKMKTDGWYYPQGTVCHLPSFSPSSPTNATSVKPTASSVPPSATVA